MALIECSGCKELKPENHFYIKSLWKRMSDGSIKRYEPRRVKRCNHCIYEREKEGKKLKRLLKNYNPSLHKFIENGALADG